MHYADLELVVTNERGEDASYDSILRLFIKHIRKGNGIVDFPPTYRAKSIHATGCGNNGALGLGNEEDRKEYEKIENVTNIYTFATGGDHAHASTKHGLYSWGSGRFSQLGGTPITIK
jgi:alpha-tubulin suppressor-like RCC1 family protein